MEDQNLSLSPDVQMDSRIAFESIQEEIASVPDDELVHINVDIAVAVTTVLGSLSTVMALREQLVALPDFDKKQFDKLELYTRSLYQANSLYNLAARPLESLPKLGEEGTQLRDLLYTDAVALVQRGLMRDDWQRVVRVANGYKALAQDLSFLTNALDADWDRVKEKTAVTVDDLNRAQSLVDRILTAVANKELAPSSAMAKATLTRQRAYTLFFRAYDNARRAVSYLRWSHGDADKIAPSIFLGRNSGKRRSEDETGVQPDEAGAVEASGAMPGGNAMPVLDGTPARPMLTGLGGPLSPIPPGMPGADPYVRG